MAPMTAAEAVAGVVPTVSGLPLHPLVVHVAVVLLPLSALAALALLAVPRWRRAFGPLAAATALVGAVAAFVARRSGEDLAGSVGRPAEHAAWGDRLAVLAVAYALLVLLWCVLDRREGARHDGALSGTDGAAAPAGSTGASSVPARVLAPVVAVVAVATVGVTIVTGHSGATAVWGEGGSALVTAPPSATPGATATGPSPDPTAPAPAAPVYTLDEVAQHASDTSCWAAIDGGVYDLTPLDRPAPRRARRDPADLRHRRVGGLPRPARWRGRARAAAHAVPHRRPRTAVARGGAG